jgi:hypothetical protein
MRDTSWELQNLFSTTYMILNQFDIYSRCSRNKKKKKEKHVKKRNSMATTSMDQESVARLKYAK